MIWFTLWLYLCGAVLVYVTVYDMWLGTDFSEKVGTVIAVQFWFICVPIGFSWGWYKTRKIGKL